MNFKTTYILFGGLVLLLAVAAIFLVTGPKAGEEGKLVRGTDAKDVTRVTVERKQPTEERLVFVRAGKDKWKLEEPYAAAVDSRQVDNLVSDILGATTITKGVDLTNNPAQFGLDKPSLTVALDAGDRTTTVNFGRVTLGSGGSAIVYANTTARKEPVAVRKSGLSSLLRDLPEAQTAGDLFKNVSEFRARELLLENAFNAVDVVRSVHLKGDKGEVVLNKTGGGTWQFEKPAGFGDADAEGDFSGGGPDAPPNGVKPLLTALSNLRVGSADDFVENVKDFKQYGLEPGKEAGPRIEVVRKGSGEDAPPVTEVVTVGKKEDNGDKVFVRPGNENVVAKVPANLIDPVRKVIENPAVLRSRTLLPNGTAGVDALDVQVAGDPPIELRKLADGWKLYAGAEPKPANATTIQGLLADLSGKRIVRDFPDPKLSDADKGFDKPSAVVTLWVNGIVEEKKDEKTDEKKGGEEQEQPAKKDEPKDKGVPKKDDAKDKAAKPAEKKDEPKKEEPKPPAKPKLKEPAVKLIFGKRDKDLLYVRREQGGQKADFAVSESLLPKLTHGRLDYLDPTLPSFNLDNVTKLTFNKGGETWVVEKVKKEKEPATWVIKQPSNLADRPADSFKVSSLLGDLAGLRAERLWAEKATDRELERFGLKPPKLTATVSLSDEKDKERTYLFGADTDDKSQAYARQGERDLVFSVRRSTVEALQSADLTDPTVFRLDVTKVNGMKLTGWKEFSVNGQPQTLDLERKGSNNWSVKGNTGYKLSASQAEAFLANLAVVRAEKFVAYKTGPKPEYKLTPADGALVVEVTLDGEKEPTTLALGAEVDGKSYYATSNKAAGDVFLVPKDRFEKYKTKPGAFAAKQFRNLMGDTRITRAQWLTLAAALLGWAFDGFEMGVFPIVARPALRDLLGTGVVEETVRHWNAVLVAAFLFGAAAGGWLFGWLGDRVGRVRAMVASVLTYALLTGVSAAAQSPWQLAGLRFLAALGMGGEWALGVALVMETWPARYRPVLAGLIGAAANLGYTVVAAVALVLNPEGYWRWLFVVCAGPAVLTFFVRMFVPESEAWRSAAAGGPKVGARAAFAPGLRRRAIVGAAAGAVALLATWGAVQFTQLWAQQMTRDGRAAAYVQITSAGAATVGAFLAPVLLRNVGRRVGYAILCLVALAASEWLFLGHDRFDTPFLLAVAATGVASAAFYGWLPLYLPELFPTRVRAAGQGFCYNAGRSLAAVGVLLTTFRIDVQGDYPAAAARVCLVYVVGVGLAWLLPETRGKPLPG